MNQTGILQQLRVIKTEITQGCNAGFRKYSEKDPSSESARFLLGMSQLALQNYNQTINLLTAVSDDSGEYGKEARWYLGLSYLKTGNKAKQLNALNIWQNQMVSTGNGQKIFCAA